MIRVCAISIATGVLASVFTSVVSPCVITGPSLDNGIARRKTLFPEIYIAQCMGLINICLSVMKPPGSEDGGKVHFPLFFSHCVDILGISIGIFILAVRAGD
jgi:hypothetical protein